MHALTRLAAAALCAAAAASAVQAQVVRSISTVPNTAPSATAQASRAAPNPSGLRPIFPAGVSSGSGAAVSTDPIAATTSPVPPAGTSTTAPTTGTTTTAGGFNNGRIIPELPSPDTAVLGAGAATVVAGGATVRGPGQTPGGAGGFSATDIARSFFFADANKDGDLTRSEAARLSIMTMPFEEMDRNFDGLISRFEYEDSVR